MLRLSYYGQTTELELLTWLQNIAELCERQKIMLTILLSYSDAISNEIIFF